MSPCARWAAAAVLLTGCVRYNETEEDRAEREKAKPQARAAKEKQLKSLGYVDGTVDPNVDRSGVILHDRSRVEPGYNFYTSRKQYSAQLVDMQGAVVHTWELGGTGSWQHATLLPGGDILVLVKDKQILRLDKDSNVLWSLMVRAHHDLWVHTDGDIYTLARRRVDAPYHPRLRTVEDYVLVVSPDGQQKGEISILRAIENSPHAYLLARAKTLPALTYNRPNPRPDEEFDILHTNHVEVMDGHLADRDPLYAKGNLLVSPRGLNSALVLDAVSHEVLWIWGPNNLIFPHHPSLTPDGNILIFNNGNQRTGSQVIEINPLTNEIVWTYGPVDGFFSVQRGSNQRLPGGNTLITESDTGYVHEVTANGKVVWTFVNPHTKKRKKLRMAIWRMTRFAPEALNFEFNGAQVSPE